MMQTSPSEDATMLRIRQHLDSIITFLNPLLPLANCHMVEFFTQNHWETFVPSDLRKALNSLNLNDAVDKFWELAESNDPNDNSELGNWIHKTRSNCIKPNNEYCITTDELQERIEGWGGKIYEEIRVKDFMNNKKSYEVQTMSRLVASLQSACGAHCCVEAGGGRGPLPRVLSLGYGARCLTIDCNEAAIATAEEKIGVIQKQWHAIAKRVRNGTEEAIGHSIQGNLQRFACAYVTSSTDMAAIVREKFPELAEEEVRLLLTGLHTCGNLGPSSLRIFVTQPRVAAVFNAPCCYHLLTEAVDEALFDVFQKGCGGEGRQREGFPMTEHLRGYNLGRNARMLAAQSIDRVVNARQLPSKSLLYRALLQVIVKKHLPDFPLTEGKLKRITNKCEDFEQYFKMADKTLNLKLYETLPSNYFDIFCEDIDSRWKQVVLFYLLRLCLAQVVESVILLDRVLYLSENGFRNVFLVKLFDPVLSPRCHSIVAVR